MLKNLSLLVVSCFLIVACGKDSQRTVSVNQPLLGKSPVPAAKPAAQTPAPKAEAPKAPAPKAEAPKAAAPASEKKN